MTTTPEVPAELATASAGALLDAMVQLTHRIHVVAGYEARGVDPVRDVTRLAGLRKQRGMVRAEILRRIEGGS